MTPQLPPERQAAVGGQQLPVFPPGHPDAPPTPVEPAPPGMVWAIAPNGDRVLAYYQPEPQEQSSPAPPAPMPAWAKGTALVMMTGSVASLVGAIGLHLVADDLDEAAIFIATIGVVLVCIGLVVTAVARSWRKRPGHNITINATPTFHARSIFGGRIKAPINANATIKGK